MGQVVRFLFGNDWAVFKNGRFGFDVRPRSALLVLVALALGAYVYFIYVRPRMRLARGTRAALVLLRTALIALIVFLLLRPVVVVSSVVPRSSYVAVVIDDSLSMKLNDAGARTRLEAVKHAILSDESSFLKRLDEKFRTQVYAFSQELVALRSADNLYGEGRTTDVAGALEQTARRSAGIPLSAIVIATDGAANVPRDLTAVLRELGARDIPVFTIGVGSTSRGADAELVRLSAPRRALVGSRINLEALVSLSGYGPSKVLMGIREDGRAIKTEAFDLRGNETQTLNIEVVPSSPAWHRYTVEITPLDGELTVENNKQDSLVEVIEGPERVLYVEGEPRWELGKIRESLQPKEKNVTLVSLQRTGENKFYRQGIVRQEELAGGFPRTEEELFAYQGLILGSVEASFFTTEQLRSIEAFVSRRGGGLLLLGGRLALDGGKYKGTPIADALPLSLEGRATEVADSFAPVYKPRLTAAGLTHPITRLAEDRTLSLKTWNELPPVSVSEILNGVKPGASVLIEAFRPGAGSSSQTAPLLVQQRYGRGQSLVFAATDTWRWRMRMESKSNAHETFWRQMLRYLVSTTPAQTEISAEHDVFALNETVRLMAEIRDKRFNPVSDAQATARVTKPSGATLNIPLRFTTLNDVNAYAGEFSTDELGQHRIELISTSKSTGQASALSNILVTELNREWYGAAQNSDLLKRIAAETGGRYYQLGDIQSLVDDLTYRHTPFSERTTRELWDMPINFMLLVGLLSAEWFLRKREGLA